MIGMPTIIIRRATAPTTTNAIFSQRVNGSRLDTIGGDGCTGTGRGEDVEERDSKGESLTGGIKIHYNELEKLNRL